MSREIRRVPKNWQHPKDESTGRYKPLFDNDYDTAAANWIADLIAWENNVEVFPSDGKPIDKTLRFARYFWEYAGNPPDADYYRAEPWAEPPTCYQVYETVSEGTPVSPVFETLDAMVFWLVNTAGYSQLAAERFAKNVRAMSAMFNASTGKFASDIQTLDMD